MWLSSSCKLDFITIKFAVIFNGQLLKTLSSFLSTRKYSVWKITFLFSIWSRRSVVQQKRCQRESVIPVCHRRFAVAPLMAWWCSVCETDLSVLVPQIRKKKHSVCSVKTVLECQVMWLTVLCMLDAANLLLMQRLFISCYNSLWLESKRPTKKTSYVIAGLGA